MTATVPLELSVNGRRRSVTVAAHHTLLDVLREDLGLTGTKECCLVGECGACTVLVDGLSVDSCLALAAEMDGRSITTVEGLAGDGHLTPVQQAFLDTGAAQCGFCIPGQVVSAHALLSLTPRPSREAVEEGLAGNLCRCAGYEQIIEAVLLAADTASGAGGHAQADHPAREPVAVDMASRPDAREAPQ